MSHPPAANFHLGLIGFPLGHSLSPQLHAAALRSTGLSGDYQLFLIHPFPEGQPALGALLARLRQGELQGLNVTIPHKQNVIPLLDELTPAARAIGAVNTLYCRDGRLVGDNTDAAGFMTDLSRLAPLLMPASSRPSSLAPPTRAGVRGGSATKQSGLVPQSITPAFNASDQSHRALVLGAGGSAHAVVYALAHAGWQVCIAARRVEQAQQLAGSLKDAGGNLNVLPLEPGALAQPFSLLVNTTPLGMSPHPQASPWPAGLPFPNQAFVYDLVYNPRETCLVQAARAAGLQAANGLGMLIEQAILAFETWTARRPDRQALWEAVLPEQEHK